jgi:hypothetical protein
MYGNIIAIHNVLKKKTTYLNFQPAQYLKKLAKIILNQKNLKKKEKKRRRNQFWVKKKHVKKKKTCCYSEYPTRFRVFYNDSYVILYNKKD